MQWLQNAITHGIVAKLPLYYWQGLAILRVCDFYLPVYTDFTSWACALG
ncbi:hypothetical protein [Helicobacter vulpis]|nr:hypothetical protein [Helicobacter vulpis]